MTSNQLVQKLWNYCNILRDDGLSYGDYVEQLTFLLFLKMADEQEKPPFNRPSRIPKGFGWATLIKLDGDDLETHYRRTLEELGKRPGMLGVIFRKAVGRISRCAVAPGAGGIPPRRSTASRNPLPSSKRTNSMTSPPRWQPKHHQR